MYDLTQLSDLVTILLIVGVAVGVVGLGLFGRLLGKRHEARRQTKAAIHARIEAALKEAFAAQERDHRTLYPPHFNKEAKRNLDKRRAVRRALQKEGRKNARKGS